MKQDQKIDILALIVGLVLIVAGIGLLVGAFFVHVLFFHAIAALVLGIVILVTLRQQEKIEQIKDVNARSKRNKNN